MRHLIAFVMLAVFSATAAGATPRAEAVLKSLGADRMIELMRIEGLEYGADLARDMFPDRADDAWDARVSEIYSTGRMMTTFLAGFDQHFAEKHYAEVEAFYGSDLGKEVVALELATREAFLEEEIEDFARTSIEDIQQTRPELFDRIIEFIEINNLVEENVIGALNANFAFMQAMSDGGGYAGQLSNDEIIGDVVAQEPEIRQNSTEWLFAYLTMAYSSLSLEDLDSFIALSRSEAGQALTTALFEGFDDMFVEISRDLGHGVSRYTAGEDI